MLDAARQNKAQWDRAWADAGRDAYEELPAWLQSRVSRTDARRHHVRQRVKQQPDAPVLDLETYRYKPKG